jgi:hypothetical protein
MALKFNTVAVKYDNLIYRRWEMEITFGELIPINRDSVPRFY